MLRLFPSHEETIEGVSASLRTGQRTSVSVVEACLRQIDAWEPKIHAWVRVDDVGALDHARELDAELAAGRCRGALHGIPIGIKDLVDVAGWSTGAGSKLLATQVVHKDAPLVAQLREAGAIILGKTVTTQFACFDPPATRNPWNLERTPGGSSSGSAAAVATGMCLGGVGSQTGGSITRPASFCGVAGCKPTIGTISTAGVYPVSKHLDHPGPIARTVTDLAILLEVLSPSLHLSVALSSTPPRIGRLHGMFDERAEPPMRDAFDAALGAFAYAGARVVDVDLPGSYDDVLPMHRRIMLYELGEVHRERFAAHPDDYLPGMRGLIVEAGGLSSSAYDEALVHQKLLRTEIASPFNGVDVLACPATLGPAPAPATTGDPAFNAPWSYIGLPTVSFPIGVSPEGLPLAIQLVARHNEEPALFRAALWCEDTVRQQLGEDSGPSDRGAIARP